MNRTVLDSDWRFDNRCGSHLQIQVSFITSLDHDGIKLWPVIDLIGQVAMLLVVCLSPPTLYEKIKTYKSSLHSLLTSIHQSTNPTTPALKLGKRCLTGLLFRRRLVTKGELELVVTTVTNRAQKMTPKTSTCVAVPINLPLSRTWITPGCVWRISWCEINSVSMINIGCENRYFATRLTAEIQVAGKYTF